MSAELFFNPLTLTLQQKTFIELKQEKKYSRNKSKQEIRSRRESPYLVFCSFNISGRYIRILLILMTFFSLLLVIHLLRYEPEFLIYGFWMGTVVCVCAGLFFSGVGAVFAAINTATKTERCISKVSGLYVWNSLACNQRMRKNNFLFCNKCFFLQWYLMLLRWDFGWRSSI